MGEASRRQKVAIGGDSSPHCDICKFYDGQDRDYGTCANGQGKPFYIGPHMIILVKSMDWCNQFEVELDKSGGRG